MAREYHNNVAERGSLLGANITLQGAIDNYRSFFDAGYSDGASVLIYVEQGTSSANWHADYHRDANVLILTDDLNAQGAFVSGAVVVAAVIGAEDIVELHHALGSEAETRTTADTALDARIDGLSDNLTAETAERTAAVSSLNTRVDGIGDDLDAEAVARVAEDNVLGARVDTAISDLGSEAATREAADVALGRLIMALSDGHDQI